MNAPFNPLKEVCRDVQDYMFTARLFRSYPDALDFMFGPPDHNAHVCEYRRLKWLAEREAMTARANAAVAAETNKIIAEWRTARVAPWPRS